MNRVGDNGHAVGEPAPDERDDGKGEVDEEGREDVTPRAVAMQVDMIVCHNASFLLNKHAKVRIYTEFRKNKCTFSLLRSL